MKIGIRAHDLPNAPYNSPKELIDAFKQFDLNCLQLVYKKAFKDFDMNPNTLLELSDLLKENNIEVSMLGAYFNMIHPDNEKKEEGKEYFKWCSETAFVFDTKLVGSETGSFNGDKWTYNEKNHNEEAYKMVLDTVKEIKSYANRFKACPIIEGAYAHTIYNPDLLKRLIDESGINDVTVDIFNYLNIDNYKDADLIFDKCLSLFKDKIRVFHIKDFNVIDGTLIQCSIGEGIMNWKRYLPLIKENCPSAALILEGVVGKDNIDNSIKTIRGILHE